VTTQQTKQKQKKERKEPRILTSYILASLRVFQTTYIIWKIWLRWQRNEYNFRLTLNVMCTYREKIRDIVITSDLLHSPCLLLLKMKTKYTGIRSGFHTSVYLLTRKLLKQYFLETRLKSTLIL